ncbi:MAG: hypothetical protein WBC91_02500 [Phototrophicaceae bacterium]
MPQNSIKNCPQCDSIGRNVDNATIKSLISVSLHRVADVIHHFCAKADCDVVYFAEDRSETFYTSDIRERIYQKERNADDILVCYCFLYTLNDIKKSRDHAGENPIVADINLGIQQGHCACDWRNPQGKCCLGNVMKIVKSQN